MIYVGFEHNDYSTMGFSGMNYATPQEELYNLPKVHAGWPMIISHGNWSRRLFLASALCFAWNEDVITVPSHNRETKDHRG